MSNIFTELRLEEDVQFHTAYPGTAGTIVEYIVNYQFTPLLLRNHKLAACVIPLAFLAKQPTEEFHGYTGKLLTQRRYCLAPSFFKMLIPSSDSAISMSFS